MEEHWRVWFQDFIPWLCKVDKEIILNSFNDEQIIKLVFLSTEGPITDFIAHFLENADEKSWIKLRAALLTKYEKASKLNTIKATETGAQANEKECKERETKIEEEK